MQQPAAIYLTRGFDRDQSILNAYNRRRLGLREVPIVAIVGSVGRTDLSQPDRLVAWRRTSRYRAIYRAIEQGECLPPVDLALLDGHYYIRDGHHRVDAARRLGIIDIDAEVIEFLPQATSAAAWHRLRATFERDTGLIGLHLRRLDGYELLRRQIAEHGWYLGERGQAPVSFTTAAAAWQRDIYRPALAEFAIGHLLERYPALTATELYLAVCDHKWYRGQHLDLDIGFRLAGREFAHLPPATNAWRPVWRWLLGQLRLLAPTIPA